MELISRESDIPSSDSSLIDYFFVIGLSVPEYLRTKAKVVLLEEIEPEIISSYPLASKSHIQIEDNIKLVSL